MGTEFVMACMFTIYNINQVILRQAITPARLQGRMNASIRFLVGCANRGIVARRVAWRDDRASSHARRRCGWYDAGDRVGRVRPVRRLRAPPVEAEDEEEVAVGALS
ncbi:MAG: hypothetical protein WKH64_07915 [Chloroflexia bacterium]